MSWYVHPTWDTRFSACVCVMCHVSPVTCHMSLMPTAATIDPPSANSSTLDSLILLVILTFIHPQWVATSQWQRPKNSFFRAAIFNHFWAKIAKSETNILFPPKESFYNWPIWVLTFLNKSFQTLKKNWQRQRTDRHFILETESASGLIQWNALLVESKRGARQSILVQLFCCYNWMGP